MSRPNTQKNEDATKQSSKTPQVKQKAAIVEEKII